MTGIKQRPSDPHVADGAAGELGRLRGDSTATLEELREFLGQMRDKSPEQVLGLVAQSGLVRSTLLSAAACALGVALLTVGPYLLSQQQTPAAEAAEARQAAAAEPDEAQPAEQEVAPQQPQQAAEALGIGETKGTAEEDVPLDSLDRLLDGVD